MTSHNAKPIRRYRTYQCRPRTRCGVCVSALHLVIGVAQCLGDNPLSFGNRQPQTTRREALRCLETAHQRRHIPPTPTRPRNRSATRPNMAPLALRSRRLLVLPITQHTPRQRTTNEIPNHSRLAFKKVRGVAQPKHQHRAAKLITRKASTPTDVLTCPPRTPLT